MRRLETPRLDSLPQSMLKKKEKEKKSTANGRKIGFEYKHLGNELHVVGDVDGFNLGSFYLFYMCRCLEMSWGHMFS